ncbi:MAG: L,D-transpeptidase family protein [Bacillota bacterium]
MRLLYKKKAVIITASIFLVICLFILIYPGQFARALGIGRKDQSAWPDQPLAQILKSKGIILPLKSPRLVVIKTQQRMIFYEGNIPLKTYKIAMGADYLGGDKEKEGDERTPEGIYTIADKRWVLPPSSSLGSRWMHVSYPELKDARRGLNQGIINENDFGTILSAISAGKLPPQRTPLGGEIGIHGGHNPHRPSNWTDGCVALYNLDVEELYGFTPVGTLIIIKE